MSVDELLGMIPDLRARLEGIERSQQEIMRLLVEKDEKMVCHTDAMRMLGVSSLQTLRRMNVLHGLGGRKVGKGWVFPLSKLVCASAQPMEDVLRIEKRRKGRPRSIAI